MLELPAHLEECETTYSNCDHVHPGVAAEASVKAGTHFINHPAWEHFGNIWFHDGRFVERVWRHRTVVDVVHGDSLKEVFEAVNTIHGER